MCLCSGKYAITELVDAGFNRLIYSWSVGLTLVKPAKGRLEPVTHRIYESYRKLYYFQTQRQYLRKWNGTLIGAIN